MKIKIGGKDFELDFPISAKIQTGVDAAGKPVYANNSLIDDLLAKAPAFDAGTGLGRIISKREVGRGKSKRTVEDNVIFVKETTTGLTFPIVIEAGKDAYMACNIIKMSGGFRFQTTTSSKASNPLIEDHSAKVTVATATGTEEKSQLEVAVGKFREKCFVYDAVNKKETETADFKRLGLFFRANTRNDSNFGLKNADGVSDHLSYIKYCIPVKVAGRDGTVVVVGDNNDKRRELYYVEASIDATVALYDYESFKTVTSTLKAVHQITVGASKSDIKLIFDIKADGSQDAIDAKYDTGRGFGGIIEELNHYSPENKGFKGLGTTYAEGRWGTGPKKTTSVFNFKHGFDAEMEKDKKTKIKTCVVVGPDQKQYVVYGKDMVDLNKLGLTSGEFACLLSRKDTGAVKWIERDKKQFVKTEGELEKEVTGIVADEVLKAVWAYKTSAKKSDEGKLVVIPRNKNIVKRYFANLPQFLGLKTMTPKDASGNLVTRKAGVQSLFDGIKISAATDGINIDAIVINKKGALKTGNPLSPNTRGGNRALRIAQKAVTLILAASIATGGVYAVKAIIGAVHDGMTEHQTKMEQQMEETFYRDVIAPALDSVKGAQENAKNKAIIGFVNQSDRAVEFGREQANLNSEGVDIAGDQLIDGTFKTQLGKVVSGGFEALPNNGYSYSYNVYGSRAEGTLSDEEKQAGYQLFEHDGGYYLVEKKDGYDVQISGAEYQVEADESKPEEYQAVITTETAELSESDITDAHKENPSYVIGDYVFDGYVGYTAEGFFSQLGENAAKSALSKKSGDNVVFPIMTIDSSGNKEVVKFREAGLEDKIKKACRDALSEDGMTDEAELDEKANVLAQFCLKTFDDAYAPYIYKEYDDQNIHGSGVSDERDILASEDVKKAAMGALKKLDVSCSDVTIIPSDKDGVYYLQPKLADGSASEVIVRVQGLGSLQELENGLKKVSKDNMSVYYSATEKYKTVYSNTDAFKGVYTMRGERKDNFDSNGNLVSIYTTKAVKLVEDEEGNITFEEKDGYTVKSVGGMDDIKADIMAVYGLFSGEEDKKGKANFEGRSNYTIVESSTLTTNTTISEKGNEGK